MSSLDIYTAEGHKPLPDFEPENSLNNPDLYRPSQALKNAVNVAIALGKPLLLTGEPGTGKTQLAHSLAHQFELGSPLVFNTRTTSTATDLFYRYEALRHFQYTQNKANAELTDDELEKRFIRYQALGEAIRSNKRQVVLIDEIDKAPRDLPNDILNVLEDLAFDVPEINKHYGCTPEKRPVIIMTSNSEKNLPDAFLRRCVYFHLEFPKPDELLNILLPKLPLTTWSEATVRDVAIPHFMEIRKTLKRKKPSLAELLLWASLLEKLGLTPEELKNHAALEGAKKDDLWMSYRVLAKNDEDLDLLAKLA